MARQPYLYDAVNHNRDFRFPEPKFDPKAVTRASWQPQPRKPKPNGPLVTFNSHPDSQMVLSHRSNNYLSLSPTTKSWIKALRRVQLGLRILQMMAAAGILAILALLNNIDALAGWVMRITPGVVLVHCLYAVFHLSRPAGGRSPASSAAYQLFAGLSDLGVMPLYAYGSMAARNGSTAWTTRLADQNLLDYFIPIVYYMFMCAGGLHLVTFCISAWLGFMFRKITLMPPDMNPLEDNLTSRAKHEKNKSSVATTFSNESEKRLSTSSKAHGQSGVPCEDVSRPPSIPFQRTRVGSDLSNRTRDSRADLPSRQYQITPGNFPRDSATANDNTGMSVPRSLHRGSYIGVAFHDMNAPGSLTSTSSEAPAPSQVRNTGKFTETWFATDSLISRTQKRNRAMDAAASVKQKPTGTESYEVLGQRYNPEDSESENDAEDLASSDFENDLGANIHPNPLGSNPHWTPPRTKTPYYPLHETALYDTNLNSRQASESNNITDERPSSLAAQPWPRNRDSSIQPEADFYSKPYGDLKAATPPVMIGSNRQVSSGNDYNGHQYSSGYGRRNVSGKIAEEGLAVSKSGRFIV